MRLGNIAVELLRLDRLIGEADAEQNAAFEVILSVAAMHAVLVQAVVLERALLSRIHPMHAMIYAFAIKHVRILVATVKHDLLPILPLWIILDVITSQVAASALQVYLVLHQEGPNLSALGATALRSIRRSLITAWSLDLIFVRWFASICTSPVRN